MRTRRTVGLFTICVLCLGLVGCLGHRFERRFLFGNPPATRIDRLRKYSLEDQYRIFRYGNDHVEPPLMGLARPIAERGKSAVPFILEKLASRKDDVTLIDTLLLFETMSALKTYDVKSDELVMTTLRRRVSGVRDKVRKVTCFRMLKNIESE